MMVSKQEILNQLPPYRDQWAVVVKGNQTTGQLINNVMTAHKLTAKFYDQFATYFDNGRTVSKICDDLYKFVARNIKYREESAARQTSANPNGILTRGYGDCKHYSGFIGGVLGALQRAGRKINWVYRFASYNPLDSNPHHVFIVVNPGGSEIWIDPVPGAEKKVPSWYLDKKV